MQEHHIHTVAEAEKRERVLLADGARAGLIQTDLLSNLVEIIHEQDALLSVAFFDLDVSEPVLNSTDRMRALAEVSMERRDQDQEKFPMQAPGSGPDRFDWPMLASLVEELGEVAKEQVEGRPARMRAELVQLTALGVKALEIEYERAREGVPA